MALESRLQEITSDVFDSDEIDDVCFAVNSFCEESMQVGELQKLEDFYSKEIIGELKQIMKPRKAAFHVNPLALGQDSSVSEAILNCEAVVEFVNSRGKVLHTKPLGEFQIEIFLRVIDEILPEAKILLNAAPEDGLSAIKKISKELKKIFYGEEQTVTA